MRLPVTSVDSSGWAGASWGGGKPISADGSAAQPPRSPDWSSEEAVLTCNFSSRPAPRACGDGPTPSTQCGGPGICSPRVRGWPRLPGRAQVHQVLLPARGDGPRPLRGSPWWVHCSPRVQGWSQQRPGCEVQGEVLPARGGIQRCSPRTRGWSLDAASGRHAGPLLPAYAGMVPSITSSTPSQSPASRARGDGRMPTVSESLDDQGLLCGGIRVGFIRQVTCSVRGGAQGARKSFVSGYVTWVQPRRLVMSSTYAWSSADSVWGPSTLS